MTTALQALIVRWREEAESLGRGQLETADTLAQCADELEAALNGSPSGVDAAFEQLEHEKVDDGA